MKRQQEQNARNSLVGKVRTWIAKKNQTSVVRYKMVLNNKQVVKGIEVYDGWTGYKNTVNQLHQKLHLQARNYFNAQIVYIELTDEVQVQSSNQ